MKKFCSLIIVFCLLLSLSACGGNNSSTDTNQNGFCTKCGEEISATDKFCGSCGASVDKSTNSETTDNTTSDDSSDSNNTTITAKDNSSLKNNPRITTAYINELKNGGEFGDVNFAGYYLYDIDKDGCEELIIKAGTCEADASVLFYQYVNGEVKQLGSVSGGHSSLCANSKEPSVTIHYGTGGYEWVDSVKIENESLIVSHIVSERETLNYTEFDYCVPLTFYSIKDFSPFSYKDEDYVTQDPFELLGEIGITEIHPVKGNIPNPFGLELKKFITFKEFLSEQYFTNIKWSISDEHILFVATPLNQAKINALHSIYISFNIDTKTQQCSLYSFRENYENGEFYTYRLRESEDESSSSQHTKIIDDLVTFASAWLVFVYDCAPILF